MVVAAAAKLALHPPFRPAPASVDPMEADFARNALMRGASQYDPSAVLMLGQPSLSLPSAGVVTPRLLSLDELLRVPVPADLTRRILRTLRAQPQSLTHHAMSGDSDVGGGGGSGPALAAAAQLTMEELVSEHADAVYRVALSVTSDPNLAEDVSQDALIKAWQSLPTYRGESPIRHWILRITHNTAISALRRRREVVISPLDMPEGPAREPSVDAQVQDRLAIDRFEAALGDLDSISRSIVVLREVEGLSYAEMSDVLELPLPTIRTRLLRARRQLADALDGWQP